MKVLASAFVLVVLSALTVSAQEKTKAPQRRGMDESPIARLEKIKGLNLTDDQRRSLKR